MHQWFCTIFIYLTARGTDNCGYHTSNTLNWHRPKWRYLIHYLFFKKMVLSKCRNSFPLFHLLRLFGNFCSCSSLLLLCMYIFLIPLLQMLVVILWVGVQDRTYDKRDHALRCMVDRWFCMGVLSFLAILLRIKAPILIQTELFHFFLCVLFRMTTANANLKGCRMQRSDHDIPVCTNIAAGMKYDRQ